MYVIFTVVIPKTIKYIIFFLVINISPMIELNDPVAGDSHQFKNKSTQSNIVKPNKRMQK